MSPRLRTFDRDREPRNPGAERIHLERGTINAARSKIASLNTLGLGVPKQTGESICYITTGKLEVRRDRLQTPGIPIPGRSRGCTGRLRPLYHGVRKTKTCGTGRSYRHLLLYL